MKRILVPTDLSEIAARGLRMAVEIAKRCKATIHLVNFTRHPLGKTFTSTGEVNLKADEEENVFTLELLRSMREQMEGLAVQYAAQGVAIEFDIIDNKFTSGIDAYMSQENIDLVVMGTSGEETPKEAFTGNHTARAIRVATCPVLSVKEEFSADKLQNIVAAVRLVTDNQLAEGLTSLKTLADCFDSTVHLVHVRDRAGDATLILDEYFRRMAAIAGLEKYTVTILDSDDLSAAILHYAEQVNAGLISVMKNHENGIFRIFSNHFSDRIVKEESIPVVTLNLNN
jgi:nucleotide-binding universal stress UspA family protein